MKILITGGAGFIASNIADAYIAAGHEVFIVDDLSHGKKANLPKKAEFFEESILSPKLEKIFKQVKPDIVNHHAAQIDVRKSAEDPLSDAQTNILGSLNVIDNARKAGVQKIVFASTGGAIYGEQDYHPADLKHRTDPASPYGITKLTVEKYLQFYHWTHKIPFVALRYANVYGPRQDAHGEAGVIAIFTQKLLKKQSPIIFGDGHQTRDYVFVGDVVACNVRALEPNISGIHQVGTGVETSLNDLVMILKELTGASDTKIEYALAKPGDIMRSCLKSGALQKMPPTLLRQGLSQTVEFFSKNK